MAADVRPPRARRWPAVLGAVLGIALALLLALAGGAWWLARTDEGLAWLLAQVPGLQISGMTGRPDGGPFSVRQLVWAPAGGLRVQVDGLSWRDLDWGWRPHEGAWLRLVLTEPRAQRVHVVTPPDPQPKEPERGPPEDLRLPLELVARRLHVGALQIDEQAPVRDLRGDLHLGDEMGRVHRIGPLAARYDPAQATLQARIAAHSPFSIDGRIGLSSVPGAAFPWRADVALDGSLTEMSIDGTLAARGDARLGVQATLTPFEPWPLGALQASAERLDLSTLAATLPATRLSGRAVVTSTARDAPLSADLDLRNDDPGPWDAGRLPLRRLRATVQGRLAQRDALQFAIPEAVLEGGEPAGRLSGEGRWQGSELALQLSLEDVRPAQLDGRMAPMTLSGPLRLSMQGLPSPDPAAPRTAAAPLSGEVHADFAGRLATGGRQPVRVATDATFTLPPDGTLKAHVEGLRLVSGRAEAALTADVSRDAQQAWHVRSDGEFRRFDPSAWWSGPGGPGWQRGRHALNGTWKAQVAVPSAAFAGDWRATLRALRGEARLQLAPSRLAGVPISGRATAQAGERTTELDTDLRAAGNHVAVRGRLGAQARADRWSLDLDAPALAALAPLARLAPGAGDWVPRAGSMDADVVAEGAWPALRTEGELHARGVEAGAWRIGRADARWTATPGRVDAPLSVDLEAQGLAQGERRIETLDVQLTGTLASHRLQASARSPLRPPEWTDDVVAGGTAPPSGSALTLEATGGWSPAREGGGRWRGRIATLRAVGQPATPTPWVAARDLEAEARFGPEGTLVAAALMPGRVELLGAALQWREASYAAAATPGGAPRLAVEATLEPLAVAPWLQRLQPAFGWAGDLRVGGTVSVASAERFGADIVLQRAGGDLSVTDETGTRSLGLTDLRLGIVAEGGTWYFTQAMAGTRIGVLSGAQTVRAPAQAAWPPADAPLQGVLELRVSDLGPWSAWLPPGWRLDGQLHTSASIAGQLGAPQVSGRITGSDVAVRNLLEGIRLHDGDIAIALRGTEARIEQFQFRAGEGRLRVEGQASLGERPTAQLRLAADHFEALGRLDRRVVVSGQATAAVSPERLAVDGRFVVDEGRIDISQADAPALDDDVVVVNRPGRPAPPRGAAGGRPARDAGADEAQARPWARTDVAVTVNLGEDLRLVGRGLDTELHGELRITTTAQGEVQVHGTVRTESGTYAAYGQNLEIERGIIAFDGDVATPRLDILAARPDIDVRVGVSVQGPAAQPRVRLYSEPEMTEMEKLSWLVMGRAPEGLGRADTALLQRAALALLAGERGGTSPGIVERLGLDELSLRRAESGEVAGTVVSLGKQLSRRWFVGYERGLNAAAGSWQLIYRAARRFTLRLQTGEESSLDVIWTWRWD